MILFNTQILRLIYVNEFQSQVRDALQMTLKHRYIAAFELGK
jgi:hypothetical protein